MSDLNWLDLFNSVCSDKETLLKWGLPEPWVQTELFGLMEKTKETSRWQPFKTEIPYATVLPIHKSVRRNVKSKGAIKWVDLCLISDERNEFCWVELKVRKRGDEDRLPSANKDALVAIKRDVVALIGMNINMTEDTWKDPDEFTKTHWFKRILDDEKQGNLLTFCHKYVMAYLQLSGPLDKPLLDEDEIRKQIKNWLEAKNKQFDNCIVCPDFKISFHSEQVANEHSLILIQWAIEPKNTPKLAVVESTIVYD